MPHSKTLQLGVIIVAIQILRKLKIPVSGVISQAAHALAVSRKSGYEAARRLWEILESPGDPSGEESLRRELLRLRIRNQILTHERDHPEVRFAARRSHLPPEAKSLCVRILRDFRNELTESDIAATIGVALSSLRRWERECDAECRFPERPEHRGRRRRASPEDVERVLGDYERLERAMTLEEFSTHFNLLHPDSPLDRKTIARILHARRKREIEPRDSRKPYHSTVEVFYPGAQVAVDGTKSKVVFTSQPEDPVQVQKEVAIDLATSAILGDAVGKEEDARGVQEVVVRARRECRSVLAVLADNGSANRARSTERLVAEETEVGEIFTFPFHPQTNGHVEGLFGQFSRIVGTIEIDDTSRQTLAFSIVEIIWRVFIHFHNFSPRRRLAGMSPLEYLGRYVPEAEEVETARRKLAEQKERSENLRRPHPRLSDPEFGALIGGIITRHGFGVSLEEALKALLSYDERVIRSASKAFAVYSQRDGFDERKRTFAYFMGIARNKQKEIDRDRLRRELDAEKDDRFQAEGSQKERQRARERAEELEDLRENPERVVLKYAELLLAGGLRTLRRRFGEGLRRGLRALHRLGRGSRAHLESLAREILDWGEFREELKHRMVQMLFSESEGMAKPT